MYRPFIGFLMLLALPTDGKTPLPFRAGEDSIKLNIAISPDERRGETPKQTPIEIKKECWSLLEKLRKSPGLSTQTERNIESYFTVADAFEADGLLVQSVDYLTDLQHKLLELSQAVSGKKDEHSLIETESDILHCRDLHNLHIHDGKYLTGAQPTETGYRWLRSKGVTTVINLRKPSDHEKKFLESIGITYVHIAWADEHPPTLKQVEEMLDAVKNSKGKVLQHCLRGVGRDMTMASCYQIATHGKTANELIQEGKKSAPRWVSDQKIDAKTGEGVQFQLLREFELAWKKKK